MINEIQNDLRKVISLYKKKPYLPFWGEIYIILQKLNKEDEHKENSRIFLYKIKDHSVPIFYQPDGRFCIEMPNFNILLTQEEFIENLLLGRFWPD